MSIRFGDIGSTTLGSFSAGAAYARRRQVIERASAAPLRETPLGTLSLESRTEDGEFTYMLTPTHVPSDVGCDVLRSTVRGATISLAPTYGIAGEPQVELKETVATVEVKTVRVSEPEYTRLMALARAVQQECNGARTAADFVAWKTNCGLIDTAETRRLYFIAAQVRTYLGITDGTEFGKWLRTAIDVLKHVKRAAEAMN